MSKRKLLFLTLSISMMVTLLAAGLFGQAMQKENLYRYLSIFTEVFSLARNNYVEEVPSDRLVDGAFSGVTDAIDEFSYYVPPAQMRQYGEFKDDENNANSLGLIVSKRFGYGYVIAPVEGSPAAEAGIEAGDFIERINDANTQRMAIWEIRKALQGPESSKVRLGILRGGMSKRDEVTLTRRPIVAVPLRLQHFGTVAYVKIPAFAPHSAEQFREVLNEIAKERSNKLIVDVRGNAFGSVDEAVAAADNLLHRGVITSLTGRRVEPRQWDADNARAFDGEVLVLTDASTAGPGELFAAALRGNQRARLVGVSTYGKAVQQKFVTLPSGGGLYLTIGRYTTPDKKAITDQGVKPDVNVDLAALAIRDEKGKKSDADPILEKALRLFGEEAQAERKAA
jgi:carboxyl-terminal processing protease